MGETLREDIWRESNGVSANHLYELAVAGFDAELKRAERVLDVGCGQGNFGRFLRERIPGEIHGADGVQFPALPKEVYPHFTAVNLERSPYAIPGGPFDFIFMLEVIHYLENPRGAVRALRDLLKPGGHLILTTVNPLALPSVAVLLRSGMYREFQEGPARYPGQRNPLLPEDGKRIIREAKMELVELNFSNRSRLPGTGKWMQDLLPFLSGRWFSDHFRVVGRRVT
jgi:SAM-dependent methyltransferase